MSVLFIMLCYTIYHWLCFILLSFLSRNSPIRESYRDRQVIYTAKMTGTWYCIVLHGIVLYSVHNLLDSTNCLLYFIWPSCSSPVQPEPKPQTRDPKKTKNIDKRNPKSACYSSRVCHKHNP